MMMYSRERYMQNHPIIARNAAMTSPNHGTISYIFDDLLSPLSSMYGSNTKDWDETVMSCSYQ